MSNILQEIIKVNEDRISNDIKEIKGIKCIDFIDIFPTSDSHKNKLDEEVKKFAKLIDSTEKGNFYLLNNAIKTKWGNLRFLKIRFYDESRLHYEAAPDFEVDNWDKLRETVKDDERFKVIHREKWSAIEFKTDNCLVYFLNSLVTNVYGVKNDN